MSTPVVTDKWAGNYDCSICRRKRLVGSEFSKKSLEKYRKNSSHPLKCKQCVSDQETKERELAAAKRDLAAIKLDGSNSSSNDNSGEQCNNPVECATCKIKLAPSLFNKNQLSKGEGKARCRKCVEKAIANEAKQVKEGKDAKLKLAQEKVKKAQERGNVAEIVKAEAELCALEAEIVTGLKPKVIGRGRGKGGGRGRGGGRSYSRGRGGRGGRGRS